MPRRRIRIAAFALLLTALGAATTIAVAWGIALSRTRESEIAEQMAHENARRGKTSRLPAFSGGFVYWPADHRIGVSTLRTSRGAARNLPPDSTVLFLDSASGTYLSETFVNITSQPPDSRHPPRNPANESTERRYGWPARAFWILSKDDRSADYGKPPQLEGAFIYEPRNSRAPHSVRQHAMKGVQPRDKELAFWLPIGVLPVGFTLNTLFYAAAWFVTLFGIRIARRTLRRLRGLCTRCAYDLNGLAPGAPCPECGQAAAHSPSPDHVTT